MYYYKARLTLGFTGHSERGASIADHRMPVRTPEGELLGHQEERFQAQDAACHGQSADGANVM